MNLNYVDGWGRWHDKPVTEGNPTPCNNAFLYSCYASLVGLPVRLDGVLNCFLDCMECYGFTRHPSKKPLPASSHDELVGMCMLGEVVARGIIVRYGQQHYQVCNLPGFLPTLWRKLNWIRVVKELYALSKEPNPRKATPNYPYIMPVTFKHSLHHIYFYRRCGRVPPGTASACYFILATLFTIFNGSNSSKVMLGFKFMKLLELGPRWYESLLLRIYDKRVDFGEEVAKYFPKGHPIPTQIRRTKSEEV